MDRPKQPEPPQAQRIVAVASLDRAWDRIAAILAPFTAASATTLPTQSRPGVRRATKGMPPEAIETLRVLRRA